MSNDQLLSEYRRTLQAYRNDCVAAQAALLIEIKALDAALAENLRFVPRYALQAFAEKVQAVAAKMHLFSNLIIKV